MEHVFYKPEEARNESIKCIRDAFEHKNTGALIWVRALDNGMLQITTDKYISKELDCYSREFAIQAVMLVYKKIKTTPRLQMNIISHGRPNDGFVKIRFLKRPRPEKKRV